MSVAADLQNMGDRARAAARALRNETPEKRSAALLAAAARLREAEDRKSVV